MAGKPLGFAVTVILPGAVDGALIDSQFPPPLVLAVAEIDTVDGDVTPIVPVAGLPLVVPFSVNAVWERPSALFTELPVTDRTIGTFSGEFDSAPLVAVKVAWPTYTPFGKFAAASNKVKPLVLVLVSVPPGDETVSHETSVVAVSVWKV